MSHHPDNPPTRLPQLVDDLEQMAAACPECAAGKCDNCNGDTWSVILDMPVPCPCARAGHDQ